jgi:nucleoside-diphosphate kinase
MKFIRINEEQARQHYIEHKGKDFYDELVAHICSGPVVAMVWEGNGVIAGIRSMMGTTNPMEAMTGTIRGDFGVAMSRNLIHGSDSTIAASREIALFFEEAELISYSRGLENWI